MAFEAGPFMRIRTRGSPSWQWPARQHAGYVCADCSNHHPIVSCNRGGPYVSAARTAVDLDATAIDEQPVRRISRPCQRTEDVFPNAALCPADKPIIERLLGSIDVGAVGPTPPATKSMNDPTQHTAIIHTRLAAHVGRKQWLDPCPLCIGKPKEISQITASVIRQ